MSRLLNHWRLALVLAMGWLTLLGAGAATAQLVDFATSQLTIETRRGAFAFEVELAITPAERQQGLMYRKTLAADRGMLFDFGKASPVSMWMRNTYLSLDMVFIRDSGEVARIAAATEPMSETIIPSGEPVRAVLELPAGTSQRLDLQPGDRIRHPIFGGS